MATSLADYPTKPVEIENGNGMLNKPEDPFVSSTSEGQRPHQQHRYSSFDTQLFSLNHPSSSPSQTKRALEAHLAETDRRLQEASKLGTTLVQQRRDISDRLAEVQTQQGEREIGPELRRKLIEVEREYVEVGRESARAFLAPKNRLPNNDDSSDASAIHEPRVSEIPRNILLS